MNFSEKNISIAGIADVAVITQLLNQAYRGDTAKKGWTHEADLIAGETRTITDEVQSLIEKNGTVFLVYKNGEDLIGCVNLQRKGEKIYLGMLSVSPMLQNGGIGKKLLAAAEEYALANGCKAIFMTVISVRAELIDWYKRHGYADSGLREVFNEDAISGKHLQPLEFVVLEKKIMKR